MRATQTGRRELGQWRGSPPCKAEPLAKAKGPDSVSSDSQRDLISGMLKVNNSTLEDQGGQEDTGRVDEP